MIRKELLLLLVGPYVSPMDMIRRKKEYLLFVEKSV